MLINGCPNGEHQFEQRYDKLPPDDKTISVVYSKMKHLNNPTTIDKVTNQLEKLCFERYVCDVCVKCGMTIPRPK